MARKAWDTHTAGIITPVVTSVTAERTLTFPDRNLDLGRVDELGQVSPNVAALTATRTLTFADRNLNLNGVWDDSGWTSVAGGSFLNSWVNYDTANWNGAAYRRVSSGMVILRGLIKSGTVGSAAFTLPVGYRPSKNMTFAVPSNDAFGRLTIDSSGNVNPTIGSNVYFALDGVTFYPD